jgi:hypothetical protein
MAKQAAKLRRRLALFQRGEVALCYVWRGCEARVEERRRGAGWRGAQDHLLYCEERVGEGAV